MEIRDLDKNTINYRLDQFNRLKNDWNYNVTVKFFGTVEGQTNCLSISKTEYFYIMNYLTNPKI